MSRVKKGILSSGTNQGVFILLKIFYIPLFIHYLGEESYAQWIILFTIPSYVALSDLGVAKAAASSLALFYTEERFEEFEKQLYSSHALMFWLSILLCFIGIVSILSPLFNYFLISSHEVDESSLKYTAMILMIYAIFNLFGQLYNSVLNAIGKFYLSSLIITVSRVLEGVFVISSLLFLEDHNLLIIASCYLLVSFLRYLAVGQILRNTKGLGFSLTKPTIHLKYLKNLKSLMKPSLGYFISPFAYMLRSQLPILLVGNTLGPVVLIIFNTTRTLTNFGIQLASTFNMFIKTELSLVQTKLTEVYKSYLRYLFFLIIVSVILFFGILIFGELFIALTTGIETHFDMGLLLVLLCVMFFQNLWRGGIQLQHSINSNLKLAIYELVLTVIGLSLFTGLIFVTDLKYSLVGILIIDISLFILVFYSAIKYFKKTPGTFMLDLYTIGKQINPKKLI